MSSEKAEKPGSEPKDSGARREVWERIAARSGEWASRVRVAAEWSDGPIAAAAGTKPLSFGECRFEIANEKVLAKVDPMLREAAVRLADLGDPEPMASLARGLWCAAMCDESVPINMALQLLALRATTTAELVRRYRAGDGDAVIELRKRFVFEKSKGRGGRGK